MKVDGNSPRRIPVLPIATLEACCLISLKPLLQEIASDWPPRNLFQGRSSLRRVVFDRTPLLDGAKGRYKIPKVGLRLQERRTKVLKAGVGVRSLRACLRPSLS